LVKRVIVKEHSRVAIYRENALPHDIDAAWPE
jgi:hypothetical protein